VNLPWIAYGCDVGSSAWHPAGGLATPEARAALEKDLRGLAADGFRVVRWFLLCDGRSGVHFALDGTPLGVDDRVVPDMESALDVAGRVGVQLLPVLLDFHWCRPSRVTGGVQLGGHRDTLADHSKRRALFDTVMGPLLAKFGREPAIWAWDLMNEPEWVTLGLGTWNPFSGVEQADMHAFLKDARALAHAETAHPVTVGSASAAWLPLVADIGLDFFSPHWYDRLERRAPLSTHVSALGLDRPVVLGELPTRGSAHEADALIAITRASGYAGAFLWSVRGSDSASDFEACRARVAAGLPSPPSALHGRDEHP
jgi:hypothetical protein